MASYIGDLQVEAPLNDGASWLETVKDGYEVIEVEVEASIELVIPRQNKISNFFRKNTNTKHESGVWCAISIHRIEVQ